MERSHLEFALRNCSLPWGLPGEESASTTPEEAFVEHVLMAREERDLSSAFHRDSAIPIELDLKTPLFARRQLHDRLAFHRFNERRVCALAGCLAMGQNCAPVHHLGYAMSLRHRRLCAGRNAS